MTPSEPGDDLIHATAIVETEAVGVGTRIGAFSHVRTGAVIGSHCDLGDHVEIGKGAQISDRVRFEAGARVGAGIWIGEGASIGSNAVIGTDEANDGKTVVGAHSVVGANSTVLGGAKIGTRAVVQPGTVVQATVPARAIIHGNPGQIVGYVDAVVAAPIRRSFGDHVTGARGCSVRGVTLHSLPLLRDLRGSLSVGLFGPDIPFSPRRYFLVFDVPSRDVRGEHAHRVCHQFLVAASGTVAIVVDDGFAREEIVLDSPASGLHMPPMTWGTQYKYSADAVLLVFASEEYDPADYIRDYDEFVLEATGGERGAPGRTHREARDQVAVHPALPPEPLTSIRGDGDGR